MGWMLNEHPFFPDEASVQGQGPGYLAFEWIGADWLRFFEVNVLSGVRLARLYLPAMKRLNWGRIIFISRSHA